MSVTVMKFRAGSHVYAVAAGCVAAIGPPRMGVPHLGWVLNKQLPELAAGTRTLQLAAREYRVEVIVDGPVELVDLEPADIAPCHTATSTRILGFARGHDGVFVLLDAVAIVGAVRESETLDLAKTDSAT
jgi:hypothetical protein